MTGKLPLTGITKSSKDTLTAGFSHSCQMHLVFCDPKADYNSFHLIMTVALLKVVHCAALAVETDQSDNTWSQAKSRGKRQWLFL